MERNSVKYYAGSINRNAINRMIEITKNRSITDHDEDSAFVILDCLNDLWEFPDKYGPLVRAFLGEDWYLMAYDHNNGTIELALWAAEDIGGRKFIQAAEMYGAFRKLLLSNSDKKFSAILKHDTSYRFYTCFLGHGYIVECKNNMQVYHHVPEQLEEKLFLEFDSYDEFIESYGFGETGLESEMEKYLDHDIIFTVTDNFVKKYSR